MHRSITPSLIKEASSAVQVIEVVLISLTPPKVHVRNLEVTPEMACGVSISVDSIVFPPLAIRQPIHRIVLVHMLWMFS